jgi:hypothetical protein
MVEPALVVMSINPRFTDLVDWSLLSRSSYDIRASVINLRRTNLVLMAYSKFHHGGCSEVPWMLDKQTRVSRFFSPSMLLRCVWNYGIGDQEWATGVAVRASANARQQLNGLVIYEDLQRDPQGMMNMIMAHLGLKSTVMLSLANLTSVHKRLHSTNLCDYDDVDCIEMELELKPRYPCLLMQFNANNSQAWTVPMLRNKQIFLNGTCRALATLEAPRFRHSFELYV